MPLSKEQVRAVMSLPPEERYRHFVKQIADREEVWGLYQDGWAISADDGGSQSVPVWCAREYAELSMSDEWAEYNPEPVELDTFLSEMLPDLALRSISLAVMYLPQGEGVLVKPKRLINDIEKELENY